MPSFMYRCPVLRIHTHAWIADDVHADAGKGEFVAIPCMACQYVHLMNRLTRALAGADNDAMPPSS